MAEIVQKAPPWLIARHDARRLSTCVHTRTCRSPTYGYEERSVPRTDSTAADSPALQRGPLPPENSFLLPADPVCMYFPWTSYAPNNQAGKLTAKYTREEPFSRIQWRVCLLAIWLLRPEECRINNSLGVRRLNRWRNRETQLPCKQLISYSRGIRRIREFHAILRNTEANRSDGRNIAIPL